MHIETLEDKIVEAQAVVNLITTTSKPYEGAGPGGYARYHPGEACDESDSDPGHTSFSDARQVIDCYATILCPSVATTSFSDSHRVVMNSHQ